MRLEGRKPGAGDVNVEHLGEMQVRGLRKLFEGDGYTVTVTDEQSDIDAKAAAKAKKLQ